MRCCWIVTLYKANGCGVLPVILSLDESIQKLKTEILSQDWSLSPRKIEPLQAAFTCLKNRFNTRKNALAILTMADSVLLYAQKRQDQIPPEFIDFLKETMAGPWLDPQWVRRRLAEPFQLRLE